MVCTMMSTLFMENLKQGVIQKVGEFFGTRGGGRGGKWEGKGKGVMQ